MGSSAHKRQRFETSRNASVHHQERLLFRTLNLSLPEAKDTQNPNQFLPRSPAMTLESLDSLSWLSKTFHSSAGINQAGKGRPSLQINRPGCWRAPFPAAELCCLGLSGQLGSENPKIRTRSATQHSSSPSPSGFHQFVRGTYRHQYTRGTVEGVACECFRRFLWTRRRSLSTRPELPAMTLKSLASFLFDRIL